MLALWETLWNTECFPGAVLGIEAFKEYLFLSVKTFCTGPFYYGFSSDVNRWPNIGSFLVLVDVNPIKHLLSLSPEISSNKEEKSGN